MDDRPVLCFFKVLPDLQLRHFPSCHCSNEAELEAAVREHRRHKLILICHLEDVGNILSNEFFAHCVDHIDALADSVPVVPHPKVNNIETYEWQLRNRAMVTAIQCVIQKIGELTRIPDEVTRVNRLNMDYLLMLEEYRTYIGSEII